MSGSTPSFEHLGERFARFAAGLARPLVFFDIEATGTDPLADRIVEIALVRVSPTAVEPARCWRIDPRVRIPVEASEIHGITNRDLEGAPSFADVAEEIAAALQDADLAGFSITRFDVRILTAEFARAGKTVDLSSARIVDAQVIFHQREPRNLTAALRFYRDRELHDAHGALADAVASLEVFAGQLERYEDLEMDVAELHAVSTRQDDGYCDGARRFVWRDHEPAFNFGRLRGKSLRWVASDPQERNYLRWFVEGNFESDAKEIVRAALRGRIRRRVLARG